MEKIDLPADKYWIEKKKEGLKVFEKKCYNLTKPVVFWVNIYIFFFSDFYFSGVSPHSKNHNNNNKKI